jgi:predicted phosphodiesterase
MIKITALEECHLVEILGKGTLRLLSDLHIDSKFTDTKKVKRLLDEAQKAGSLICIFGDLLDVMGGKYDKRTLKGDIKKEHSEDNYLNCVIEDAAELLAPYVDNLFISAGNHEKEIDKRFELYLLEMLSDRIYRKTHKNLVWTKNYAGFILVNLKHKSAKAQMSKTIFYNHGKDSNAVMTFGTLNIKRNSSIIDADVFVSGHIHTNFLVPVNRLSLNQKRRIKVTEQIHVQLGTAKETIGLDYFSAKKGFSPASTSFYDLTFTLVHKQDTDYVDITEQRIKL